MRRAHLASTFVAAATAAALGSVTMAGAQDAGAFAAELRTVDVVYEEEARDSSFLTDADLAVLEDLVDELDSPEARFDVAVLGSAVTDAPSEQAFAEDVLTALDSGGRVVVLSPAAIGIASDLDDPATVERAVDAAEDAATAEQSLAAGVQAAADALGVPRAAPADDDGDGSDDVGSDGGGSSSAWLWVLLAIVVIGIIGLFWWSSRRRRQAAATQDAAAVGEGERKVRELVEHASAVIVELADHIDLAGTPPEAQDAFRRGAAGFAELQEELDAADTRPELEAVWPKLVSASWQLDVAKAIAAGEAPPPEPAPAPLFPPAVEPQPLPEPGARIQVPDLGPPRNAPPEAHYQRYDQSPFRGGNFGKALSVLIGMGMLNRTVRPPSDRGWFEEQERRGGGFWDGSISGGGSRRSSRGSTGRSRGPRINYGGRSRSMGRRRR